MESTNQIPIPCKYYSPTITINCNTFNADIIIFLSRVLNARLRGKINFGNTGRIFCGAFKIKSMAACCAKWRSSTSVVDKLKVIKLKKNLIEQCVMVFFWMPVIGITWLTHLQKLANSNSNRVAWDHSTISGETPCCLFLSWQYVQHLQRVYRRA